VSAVISPDGLYRYRVERQIAPFTGSGTVCFVMLNPSTADAETDDPTIRRCKDFAVEWGFEGLVVVNLFALRTTRPVHLWDGTIAEDPVGVANWAYTCEAVDEADLVIAAWGGHKYVARSPVYHRVRSLGSTGTDSRIRCLGKTASGQPRHPLYVRADKGLELWP
jgi:hypothetical protein